MRKTIKIRQPNRKHEQNHVEMPNTFVAGGVVRARVDGVVIKTVHVRLDPESGPDIVPHLVRILPHPTRRDRRRWVAVFRDVLSATGTATLTLSARPVPVNSTTPLPGDDNRDTRTVIVRRTASVASPALRIPTFDYPPPSYLIEGAEREYFLCFGTTASEVTSVELGGREADYKETDVGSSFWWAEFTNLSVDPASGNHDLLSLNASGYSAPTAVTVDE